MFVISDAPVSAAFWLSPWLVGVLGLLIGSFLNVVVHRRPPRLEREWLGDAATYLQDEKTLRRVLGGLPAARLAQRVPELAGQAKALSEDLALQPEVTLSKPRSRCPACGHRIAWYENIPVLSWLVLRRRCSACGTPISARYPLVELATGLLFALIAWKHGPTATTAVYIVATAFLIAAALIDFDTTLLPDELTLPLVALGLTAAWRGWIPLSLPDAAQGLLFGYGSLWAVATLYKLLRGRQGMAEGDFKLLGGLGALLGWQALPGIILLSSAVGAVVGIGMIALRNHQRDVPIPFGPYLAGGGLAAMLAGPAVRALFGGLG